MFEATESTMLSVLFGVIDDQSDRRGEYLQRFCVAYTKPLSDFLAATKRIEKEDASELVQEFWIAKMLQPPADQNLVAKYLIAREANPESSFRKYLAKSISYFFLSHYRSADAQHRRDALSIEAMEGWEPTVEAEQEEFDILWANHLLERVLKSVAEECAGNGHSQKWEIFVRLVLRPCLLGEPRPTYADLARSFELSDPTSVGNSWMTIKRMLLRHFAAAVRDYLPARSLGESAKEAEAELQEMLLALSRSGSVRIEASQWGFTQLSPPVSGEFCLDAVNPDAMFKSTSDYRAAWDATRNASLASFLSLSSSSELKDVTLDDVVAGRVRSKSVLELVRQRAKQLGRTEPDEFEGRSVCPLELYGVVYLIAIAAGRVYLNEELSSLTSDQLRSRVQWCHRAAWIDEKTTRFLSQFERQLA